VRIRFLCDGRQYSLYALELGDEHDYESFKKEQKRDRPKEMATMIQRLGRLSESGTTGKTQTETVTVLISEGAEPVRVLE
jgi:hypothetical protein